MYKICVLVLGLLLSLSICLFADTGEWTYGEVVDELTGEVSSQQLRLRSERDGEAFLLGYFCSGSMYLHSIDSTIDAQTTRARVDDREVTTHTWIQGDDDIDVIYNVDDAEYLLSGNKLLVEIVYNIMFGLDTEKTVFTFSTENWTNAVKEYCE